MSVQTEMRKTQATTTTNKGASFFGASGESFGSAPAPPHPSIPAPTPSMPISAPPPPNSAAPFGVGAGVVGGGGGGGVGIGGGGGGGGSVAPRRGKGVLKTLTEGLPRIPICESCHREIRGPFVLAMGKSWCPECFSCSNRECGRKLMDVGFVEEGGRMYCEFCFEEFLAPSCGACSRPILGDCLNAVDRQWHPDCFACAACGKPFGNKTFFLEDGKPYCEDDWNSMFTTKCVSCQFPIEAGDRWVEALDHAYHSNCFTCSTCQKNLEGQSFYAKAGRPFCKAHA